MTSQTSTTTRPPAPSTPQFEGQDASEPLLSQSSQSLPSSDVKDSRPRLTHTHSVPALSAHRPSHPGSTASQKSGTPVSKVTPPMGAVITRGYSAHLPHNPSRPPPYTYQRQHEFPPFPPLAQHPVLPFVTTAFSNQPNNQQVVAPPPKARPTIAPRASTTQRHVHSNLSTIPTMDVSKNDPTATFIRPPLVVPLSRNADPGITPASMNGILADGEPTPGTPLTYAILHTHRNWFLDADDFRKDNPNRIDYPPDLEPPRGWAPLSECTGPGAANRCKQANETKERTNAIRTKGSYAHPSNAADAAVEYGPSDDCHEKTILRCTFCRREYHGPNAKSMWRRHVYDKHKVAMKNRREGSAGMAPKVPPPKKGKTNVTASSPSPLEILDTEALTSDLTNEQNLIRLLEQVVSGNLDISLPASLLDSCSSTDDGAPGISIQSIALALQRSGISVTLENEDSWNPITDSAENTTDTAFADNQPPATQGEEEGKDIGTLANQFEVEQSPPPGPPIAVLENGVQTMLTDASESLVSNKSLTRHSNKSSTSASASHCPKRKAEEVEHDSSSHASAPLGRTPLKDNTALDRNIHNSKGFVIPGTPRKDKSKQRASPRTPGAPKISQAISPLSSPSRNPYSPTRHPSASALRTHALATTGHESYLTIVMSSPVTITPGRSIGRVSFNSPFNRRTPITTKNRDHLPTSDDALGILGTSSPRYPFDFNIEGAPNSPSYMTDFDPIPLELGTLAPAHWTPPSLGPAARVCESSSRTISRSSSVGNDVDAEEDAETDDDNGSLQLSYPEWRPRSTQRRPRSVHGPRPDDGDFDMEAFLDLEDAGPDSDHNCASSPSKPAISRGFSKEFGLLSADEVERITTNARSTFEDEARSSKRRRIDPVS